MPHRRLATGLLLLVTAILVACPPALAKEKAMAPVGHINFSVTSVAAGIGYSWGYGRFTFKGKEYMIKVKGLDIAALGYAKMNAKGTVYNLKDPRDIAGTYRAAGAGFALVEGVKGMLAKNSKGVVIDLTAMQEGVELNLGASGFSIEFMK